MPMTLEDMRAMEERTIGELPWLSHVGVLAIGAFVAIVLAMALPRRRQGLVAVWVAAVHLVAAGVAAWVWLDLGFETVMEGTIAVDRLSLAMTAILGASGAVGVALARPIVGGTDREGEFYALLTAATLAAVLLTSAADASLLALSLGLTSLASFVVTGYLRGSARGIEGSLKFYIYGTATAALMVYGLSLWFGLAGSTGLREIGVAMREAPEAVAIGSTVLVVAGLAYKASLVPLHFWAPDAYDGAPLPVAAYISVVTKLAGIAALARVLELALPEGLLGWPTAVAVVSAATMTLGNVAMIWQRNAIRMLAYSSIAQSGYLLIAVAALVGSPAALESLLFYAAAYAAANLAAFAVLLAVQRERRSVEVSALAGLGRAHPWWTAALIVALLSLIGIPPLAGFVAKLELFLAAIDAGYTWLAVLAVANTVASLFYYLRVLGPSYFEALPPVPLPVLGRWAGVATLISAAALVVVGIGAQPLLDAFAGGGLLPR